MKQVLQWGGAVGGGEESHAPLGSAGLAINFDRLSGRWCHFHHNKLPSFDKFSNPYGTQIILSLYVSPFDNGKIVKQFLTFILLLCSENQIF